MYTISTVDAESDSISTLNSDSDSDASFEQHERSTSFVSVGSDDTEDPNHAHQSRHFHLEASSSIVSTALMILGTSASF